MARFSLSSCRRRFEASRAFRESDLGSLQIGSEPVGALEGEAAAALEIFGHGFAKPATTVAALRSFAPHLVHLVPRATRQMHVEGSPLLLTLALCRLARLFPSFKPFVKEQLCTLPCPLPVDIPLLEKEALSEEDAYFYLLAGVRLEAPWTASDWKAALLHESVCVRWCGVEAVSQDLHLSEELKEKLLSLFDVTDEVSISCALKFAQIDFEATHLDSGLQEGNPADDVCERSGNEISLPHSHVSIAGITVPAAKAPRPSAPAKDDATFISTAAVHRTLHSAALALCQGQALLLEGPPGCGKTSCIHELLSLTGNWDPVWIQIDDQMDAKTLIGGYVCTATPGEFRWQFGPLAEAVREGKWVVIEDINVAPSEVLGTLVPSLETGMLPISQRAEVLKVQEGFQIIATVTTAPKGVAAGSYGSADHLKDMLSGRFWCTRMESPTQEEQTQILQMLFPQLQKLLPFAQAALLFVQCFTNQQSLAEIRDEELLPVVQRCLERCGMRHQQRFVGRHFSLRDICKWCCRFQASQKDMLHRLKSQEKVDVATLPFALRQGALQECHDCYAAFVPDPEQRTQLMQGFACLWCLGSQDIEYQMHLCKPMIEVQDGRLSIGRATLPVQRESAQMKRESVFVQIGHSARLVESLAVSLQYKEPVLLVGETGTGKTAMVQYLASQVGAKLVVLNLSQQTDGSDLLGGHRPVSPRDLLLPLVNPFLKLVRETWVRGNNEVFATRVTKYAEKSDWEKLEHAFRVAFEKVASTGQSRTAARSPVAKRQKQELPQDLRVGWERLETSFREASHFRSAASSAFAFQFVEGALLRALRQGHWLFLDEINLAPPETLHALAAVLESRPTVSLSLPDSGTVSIEKHPNFRLMAAMNPGTDFGKRDLAAPLRNKFTEFWFSEPVHREDLEMMVSGYLSQLGPSPPVARVAAFYLRAKDEANGVLTDGTDQSPCYSLRTLCRFLEYAQKMSPLYGLQRALMDGAAMAFATQLDGPSQNRMNRVIQEMLLGEGIDPGQLSRVPQRPPGGRSVLFEQFWIEAGMEEIPPEGSRKFVLTRSISHNLRNLARAVALRRHPILLQGPTSSGKTTLVSYLASQTGHRMVRINNHEHTDLQEYLGCYVADSQGQLVFAEGALVQAVRKGYWVLLDELNLAPSEVLEALNRLLDDNRELYIPDVQQTVKPHPHFMLFATQNPPRHYAGRKQLSRAFRGRFLELNVDDIPDGELAEMLEKRSQLPRSFATRMVSVMRELQRRRQGSNAFAGKHGYMTPRDLFRWADRPADGYLQLAQNGFFVLAERLRSPEEKQTVLEVLSTFLKVQLEGLELYSKPERGPLVWIPSTVRIFRLIEGALLNAEPVLLVGETGTGKTTVCQRLAEIHGKQLHILNCNLHTETSDFIGSFRPVRDRTSLAEEFRQVFSKVREHAAWTRHGIESPSHEAGNLANAMALIPVAQSVEERLAELTACVAERLQSQILSKKERKKLNQDTSSLAVLQEWCHRLRGIAVAAQMPFLWEDGILVTAMKRGDWILIDELNLAEDAVLERLNSVLDPDRSLTLAEKGGEAADVVVAHPDFRLVATMNPGGDYGKKEISPALSNRFTQVWVPAIHDPEELRSVLEAALESSAQKAQLLTALMHFAVQFREWTCPYRVALTVRDLLSVAEFVNRMAASLGEWPALLHAIAMVFLDGLELNTGLQESMAVAKIRQLCYDLLQRLSPGSCTTVLAQIQGDLQRLECSWNEDRFCLGDLGIDRGSAESNTGLPYDLSALTPKRNVFRLLRAMQLKKPVLLEGSPGVGKTSLITTLAALSGHALVRINLSEHTDMMDLLGADLPLQNGQPGEFHWCDGPLLSAIKAGDWVLLDELNLANQQVLEGLNALTDHRAEIFVPELNASFSCPPSFRLFASQNPAGQGGGRKGLPKSFLNRFSRVYTEPLEQGDLQQISTALCREVTEPGMLCEMVQFLTSISALCKAGKLGSAGGPWELNLRDFLRWTAFLDQRAGVHALMKGMEVLFYRRFRTRADRELICGASEGIFECVPRCAPPRLVLSDVTAVIGDVKLRRNPHGRVDGSKDLFLLQSQIPFLESLAFCVDRNWPALVVGPSCSGKTSLVQSLAILCNKELIEVSLTSGTDSSDLLGGFEKSESNRYVHKMLEGTEELLRSLLCSLIDVFDAQSVVEWIQIYGALAKAGRAVQEAMGTSDLQNPVTLHQFLKDQLSALVQLLRQQPQFLPILESHLTVLMTLKDTALHSSAGCFEWVDGAVVKAMERGDWVLLDRANLCNPTVLDRLNSVMEPNGVLNLNECGGVNGEARVIRPHPDFRLFLAYDPRHGEISRAMRNRSIETYLPSEISRAEVCTREAVGPSLADLASMMQRPEVLSDDSAMDAVARVHLSYCLRSGGAADWNGCQVQLNENIKDDLSCWGGSWRSDASTVGVAPTVRDLRQAVRIFGSLTEAGYSRRSALNTVLKETYGVEDGKMEWLLSEGKVHRTSKWLRRGLRLSLSAEASAFASLCRESSILWTYSTCEQSRPEAWAAALVMLSRLNPWQLLNLKTWLQHKAVAQEDMVEFVDSMLQQEFFHKFLKSFPDDSPLYKLIPLDADLYWQPCSLSKGPLLWNSGSDSELADGVLPSSLLMLYLKHGRSQWQYSRVLYQARADAIADSSLLQLSYLITSDVHLHLNLRFFHPLVLEALHPVVSVCHEMMETLLEDAAAASSSAALSLINSFLSYLHQYREQWTRVRAHQKPDRGFTESAIYVWIQIRKIVKRVMSHFQLPPACAARWRLVSKAMNEALELPESVASKPLLWKKGGHPRQHKELAAAEAHSKLRRVCEALSQRPSCDLDDHNLRALLAQLKLVEDWDRMEIGTDVLQPEVKEEKSSALLAGLASDMSLRRALSKALSIATLAAYSANAGTAQTDVVVETLEWSLAEIEQRRQDLLLRFETEPLPAPLLSDSERFELFLPETAMQSAVCREMQLDLCQLEMTLRSYTALGFLSSLQMCRAGIQERALCSLGRLSTELRQKIRHLTEYSLSSIGSVASLQDVLWSLELLQNEPASQKKNEADCGYDLCCLIGNATYQWLYALTTSQIRLALPNHTRAPTDVTVTWWECHSFPFQASVGFIVEGLTARIPRIDDAPWHLRQMQLACKHLVTGAPTAAAAHETSLQELRSHTAVSLSHILVSHLSSFPESSRTAIKQLLSEFCQGVHQMGGSQAVAHLVRCLKLHIGCASHDHFVAVAGQCLLPCCQMLLKQSASPLDETFVTVGVDPATSQYFKAQHLSFVLVSELQPELRVRQDVQNVPGGLDESVRIEQLKAEVEEIKKKSSALQERHVARPVPPQYLEIGHRIQQYCQTHGAARQIEALVVGLEEQVPQGVAAALNWMAVSKSFVLEMQQTYPLYMDILQPFLQGVLEVCLGLSALTSTVRTGDPLLTSVRDRAQDMMSIALPSNPVSKTELEKIGQIMFQKLHSPQGEGAEEVVLDLQLGCLHAALHMSAAECVLAEASPFRADAEDAFSSIARNLMEVFEKLEAHRDAKAEAETQLFKSKTQTVHLATDEENEEALYRTMFPDHRQHFADLDELLPDEMPTSVQQSATDAQASGSNSVSLVEGDLLKDLVLLHRAVFAGSQRLDTDQVFAVRYRTGQLLLQMLDRTVPKSFDDATLPGHLYHLCCRYKELAKRPLPKTQGHEIDDLEKPCLEEVLLAHPRVSVLRRRIEALLREWPENPILCQLQEVCCRILNMDVRSSVKKVLTGLELLLAKCQIWEDTAASAVSLSTELKGVSALVARWHRTELENWSSALDRVRRQHAVGAYKTWFYIFRILSDVNTSLKAEEVTAVLEEYLTTSTFGEFRERLSMLKAFLGQLKRGNSMTRLINILQNLIIYYSQYIPLVESSLKTELSVIEKELQDFVKLQKWEDRGYFTMKTTGERAQKKLRGFCRKADEILKRPVAIALSQAAKTAGYPDLSIQHESHPPWEAHQPSFAATRTCAELIERILQQTEEWTTGEGRRWVESLKLKCPESRFNQLPRLVERMKQLLLSSSVRSMTEKATEGLDGMSHGILCRIAELQKDRDKAARGQKRKALSDFLKLLLEMGISRRRSDIPKDEQCVSDWFARVTLQPDRFLKSLQSSGAWTEEKTQALGQMLEKTESYYYRSVDRMQRIWEAQKNPSRDLSPFGEVPALCHSAENFLYLIRKQRSLMALFFDVTAKLTSVMASVASCEERACVAGSHGTETPHLPFPSQKQAWLWMDRQWTALIRLRRELEATARLVDALKDVEQHPSYQRLLTICVEQCQDIQETLDKCVISLQDRDEGWMSHKDLRHLTQNFQSLVAMSDRLRTQQQIPLEQAQMEEMGLTGECLSDCVPTWKHLMHVVRSEAEASRALLSSSPEADPGPTPEIQNLGEFAENLDRCTVELMLWVQQYHHLRSEEAAAVPVNFAEMDAMFSACFGLERLRQITHHISDCVQDVVQFSEAAWSSTRADLSWILAKMLGCISPAGDVVFRTLEQVFLSFVKFHHQSCKLCYISMNIVLGLMTEGFCTQPDGDPEEADEDGGFGEDEGGTGMAEGQGRKDVSDEIENQDQVSGLKNDEQKNAPPGPDQEDVRGIEMEEDFDGRMENIEQEEDQNAESEDSDRDADRLEDEMGKVGVEGETVDERLWDAEEDPEMEGASQDDSRNPERGGAEYMEGQLDRDETDPTQARPEAETIEREEHQPDEEDAEEAGDETEGEGPPQPGSTKLVQPEEELQLEEETQLDGEGANDDDSVKGSDQEMPDVEEPPIQKFEDVEQEEGQEGGAEEATPEGSQPQEAPNPGDSPGRDGVPQEGSETAASGDEMEVVPEMEEWTDAEEGDGPQGDPSGRTDKAVTSGCQEGNMQKEDVDDVRREGHEVPSVVETLMEHYEAAPQSGPSAMGAAGGGEEGAIGNAEQSEAGQRKEYQHREAANPLRSLGDALEDWKRDLSVMETSRGETRPRKESEAAESGHEAMEYEYLQEGEAPENGTQTLGAATEDQMAQMSDLQGDKVQRETDPEPVLEPEEIGHLPLTVTQGSMLMQNPPNATQQEPASQENSEPETQMDLETGSDSEMDVDLSASRESQAQLQFRVGAPESSPEEVHSEGKELVERAPGASDGQEIWQQCQAATFALAAELTEHLRLLLEPTRASRLAGDYRTGKRINMKRVIPYVASQYRRDKIWLRRTKPNKRTYQVLLAIDDSKSMSENGCGRFALETLTLITRAMSRLEVGELGLISFGGSGNLKVLHPLGMPFSDANGPDIVEQMHFDQDNRIEDQPMVHLIRSLQQMLEAAEKRQSHRALQLVTIIADGRFHERSLLKRQAQALCHRAGILISFIILDNPEHSLLDLSTVSFENGEPQFKKYLDEFPFPFYIVLKDIAALPKTMADLLRQWFRISTIDDV